MNLTAYYFIYHRLRGSASPVLMATGWVKGEWQKSTPRRSETPRPIDTKFETGDYVGETIPRAKFRANPSIGGFSANRWNITKIFLRYIYLFFVDRPTGQTGRQIFAHDGSNDAVSRNGVPF